MRIKSALIGIPALMFVFAACNKSANNQTKDPATDSEVAITAVDQRIENQQPDSISTAEEKQVEEAQLAMLKSLLSDYAGEDEDKLRQCCTEKAIQQLRDDNEYECPEGDCLAIWAINGREASCEAKLASLNRVGRNKYQATFTVSCGRDVDETSLMEYRLVEEDGQWKIDNYRQLSYK